MGDMTDDGYTAYDPNKYFGNSSESTPLLEREWVRKAYTWYPRREYKTNRWIWGTGYFNTQRRWYHPETVTFGVMNNTMEIV